MFQIFVVRKLAQLQHITNDDVGAPLATGRILKCFKKSSRFNSVWISFCKFLKPFGTT